jgi:general secretion pathway protein M
VKQNIVTDAFSGFWQQRNAKERRMLTWATIVVLVAITFWIFVNPAIENIAKLKKINPQLQQQVRVMAAMSTQYSQIASAVSENIEPVSREQIEASLLRRSIKTQNLSASDDFIRVQIATVAYSNIMEWMLEMQKAARLTVDEIKVTALPENGQVSVVLTLRRQRSAS